MGSLYFFTISERGDDVTIEAEDDDDEFEAEELPVIGITACVAHR